MYSRNSNHPERREGSGPSKRPATRKPNLEMRSAVRVRSSAAPIRLLQTKYTEFSKPSVRRRGFSDTTQQARLQG